MPIALHRDLPSVLPERVLGPQYRARSAEVAVEERNGGKAGQRRSRRSRPDAMTLLLCTPLRPAAQRSAPDHAARRAFDRGAPLSITLISRYCFTATPLPTSTSRVASSTIAIRSSPTGSSARCGCRCNTSPCCRSSGSTRCGGAASPVRSRHGGFRSGHARHLSPGRVRAPANVAAYVAVGIYALNPNLLYLQTTAMNEPIFLAFFIWSLVYLDEFLRATLPSGSRLTVRSASNEAAARARILRHHDGRRSAHPLRRLVLRLVSASF